MEDFMSDIEDDVQMRQEINVYKDENYKLKTEKSNDFEFPEIPIEELLDDLHLDD